jgi:hypothetical protein
MASKTDREEKTYRVSYRATLRGVHEVMAYTEEAARLLADKLGYDGAAEQVDFEITSCRETRE